MQTEKNQKQILENDHELPEDRLSTNSAVKNGVRNSGSSTKDGDNMEAIKIIMPATDRKPCVCGATLYISRAKTNKRHNDVWLCSRHCGARGLSYEGALRRKVRLDLLGWGDLRRNAQALMAADEEQDTFPLQ